MSDRPRFEVVTAATEVEQRRLVPLETAMAVLGAPDSASTTVAMYLDGVSATCARIANLARAGVYPATFGRETVRATWSPLDRLYGGHCGPRDCELALPWRVPIVSVTVTESGTALESGDFEVLSGAILRRLSGGSAVPWSAGSIVVEYVVGWTLDDPDDAPPPADLATMVLEQVRMNYEGRLRDPALRSESTAEVGSSSYAVIGGDSIGGSGLLMSLEAALAPYKRLAVA